MVGARLVLLVILLSSAVMSNGIRTAGTVAAGAPAPAVVMTQAAAVEVTAPVATAAAATTDEVSSSSEHQAPSHGPYEDSKRKVPNGPDPIHNRRARWGDAPATRV